MLDAYQSQELFIESLGICAYKKKAELIALLRKNGIKVDDNISEKDLIKVAMVACAKSQSCRKDLTDFLTDCIVEEQVGYVQEDFFSQTGQPATGTTGTKKKKPGIFTKKEGGSAVGNFLRTDEGKDTVNKAINAGISLLFKGKDKTQANAALNQAADQADNAGAGAAAADTKKSKWVLPAIIGGVIVIGAVIYFATRKKK